MKDEYIYFFVIITLFNSRCNNNFLVIIYINNEGTCRMKETSQQIITKGLMIKYMDWYNLNCEEAMSFILSNPFYFVYAYVAIVSTANLIIDIVNDKL